MRSFLHTLVILTTFVAHGGAETSPRIDTITAEDAKQLAQENRGKLLLDGLTTLSPEAAAELARSEGWLSLNGLTSLSNETAVALAQHKGQLYLDGLTHLSEEQARALAGHNGELTLNGLTSLSDNVAGALSQHKGGRLFLTGLTELLPSAVRALTQRKGGGTAQLCLDGLTTLSPEVAGRLATLPGHAWNRKLPKIRTVSNEVARELAKREGGYSMEGLTELSGEAATVLGPKLNGRLPALKSLSPDLAKALAKTRGVIVLDGLTTLADDAAAALANDQHRGDLHLNGLTTLSSAAARSICKREGDLYLNGLTAISDETLKALAEHKAPGFAKPVVYLDGLTTLSDEGVAVLASWPKWSGTLPALPTLSVKGAAALASSRNWDGTLPALKTLPVETARALAQRKGNLSFDSLTTLSDEAVAALGEHQGGTLSLNGLKELSEKSAAGLALRNGRLSLNGLPNLSSGAAVALAKHQDEWLFLDGLTTLSDEAARSLAQSRGTLSLLGLKKLSDDGVKSLRANSKIVLTKEFKTPLIARSPVATADKTADKFVRSFLESHCAQCHDGGEQEGEFALGRLAKDDVGGRVAFASIFERLRAGDMPPPSEDRPDANDVAKVVHWIQAKLDTPLAGPATSYAVKEKPSDGNRLPNAILFGGPRGPSVPPPPRLWRLSPSAYTRWTGEFNSETNGLQQPFGVSQEVGIKDFAALYSPDEGATGLLLTNAELIVGGQTRNHRLVKLNDEGNHQPWPNEARAEAATPEEREYLKSGLRVNHGHGVFAPLLHPQVRANQEELKKALGQQYQTAVARPPSEKELESLLALYNDIAADGDCSIAGKTILMAPLMAPEAILRFEVGLGQEVRPGVRSLSPRETALAISLVLSTKRDPGLLSAAAEGKLTTRAEVAESVRRILDDPKISKPLVMGFFREYFDYYRAPEVFKDPLPDYLQRRGVNHNPRDRVDDTDVLVLSILSRDKDVLKELLTTPESYATHELFGPVGTLDGLRSGETLFRLFGPVALQHRRPQQDDRIGILMQPSWHVAWSTNFHNDIVRRGRWVREHLLGGRVPDLPINVAAMIPDDPHRTLRERQMVTRAAECWKCHNKMDELGLPFENLDHYARLRRGEEVLDLEATANSKDKNAKIYRQAPLDTTGFIAFSGDPALDGPVRDAPEMLRRLAESDRVRQIFIRHVFRYFLGRNETPGDAISLQESEKAYLDNGGSFKALLVSLLSSESFLYRTIPNREG